MEHEINLQDGRIVQGFPKQDTIIEKVQESVLVFSNYSHIFA